MSQDISRTKSIVKSSAKTKFLFSSVTITAVILFLASTIRHLLLQSNAYDLGIFDQGIYLISQGKPAISSIFRDIHIFGDHAAWIHYLIAIFYKIIPSVYWLFLIQAL